MTGKKRYHCISMGTILPFRNASLLLHLIGMSGLLALMAEENDFCIQHEMYCELLKCDDLSNDPG